MCKVLQRRCRLLSACLSCSVMIEEPLNEINKKSSLWNYFIFKRYWLWSLKLYPWYPVLITAIISTRLGSGRKRKDKGREKFRIYEKCSNEDCGGLFGQLEGRFLCRRHPTHNLRDWSIYVGHHGGTRRSLLKTGESETVKWGEHALGAVARGERVSLMLRPGYDLEAGRNSPYLASHMAVPFDVMRYGVGDSGIW